MRLSFLLLLSSTSALWAQAPTVTGISATFSNGQTFVTWTDAICSGASSNCRYNVYWYTSPITNANLTSATLVQSLVFNNSAQRTDPGQSSTGSLANYLQASRQNAAYDMAVFPPNTGSCGSPASHACGTPATFGTGLAVHTATQTASAYYAVITHDVTNGSADSGITPGSNATTTPISESVSAIQPIKLYDGADLTHTQGAKMQGTAMPLWIRLHASENGYCTWANANWGDTWEMWGDSTMGYQEGIQQAFSVGVATTAWPFNGATNAVALKPCDTQWTPNGNDGSDVNWMGYIVNPLGQPTHGYVWPFIENWVRYLVGWVKTNYASYIDTNRIYGYGHSMGSWGTESWSSYQSDIFAAVFAELPRVAGHDPAGHLPVADFTSGDVTNNNVSTSQLMSDGVTTYANKISNPTNFGSPNCATNRPPNIFGIGRNDEYANWSDIVSFVASLKACHYAFAVQWDNGVHATSDGIDCIASGAINVGTTGTCATTGWSGYQAVYVKNVSYPAFTNSSLDNNIGNGSITNGDCISDPSTGSQPHRCSINFGWTWTVVSDTATTWSATISNVLGAATVDITPRNTQNFKPSANRLLSYTISTGGSGTVTTDTYGLATIPAASIGAAGSTVTITSAQVLCSLPNSLTCQ